MKFVLTTVLLIELAHLGVQGQSSGTNQPLNRQKALAMLAGCRRSLASEGCNEDAASYLIGLYERGDASLLKPLLDTGPVSDGALSQTLGVFYGELLWKSPRAFLNALALRPKKEQRQLAWMAGAMDGSGVPKEVLAEVRANLLKMASQKHRLSHVAKLCLSEVDRANGAAR